MISGWVCSANKSRSRIILINIGSRINAGYSASDYFEGSIRGDLVVAVYLDTWCRDLVCTVRIAIASGNREYVVTMMWEYHAVLTC